MVLSLTSAAIWKRCTNLKGISRNLILSFNETSKGVQFSSQLDRSSNSKLRAPPFSVTQSCHSPHQSVSSTFLIASLPHDRELLPVVQAHTATPVHGRTQSIGKNHKKNSKNMTRKFSGEPPPFIPFLSSIYRLMNSNLWIPFVLPFSRPDCLDHLYRNPAPIPRLININTHIPRPKNS